MSATAVKKKNSPRESFLGNKSKLTRGKLQEAKQKEMVAEVTNRALRRFKYLDFDGEKNKNLFEGSCADILEGIDKILIISLSENGVPAGDLKKKFSSISKIVKTILKPDMLEISHIVTVFGIIEEVSHGPNGSFKGKIKKVISLIEDEMAKMSFEKNMFFREKMNFLHEVLKLLHSKTIGFPLMMRIIKIAGRINRPDIWAVQITDKKEILKNISSLKDMSKSLKTEGARNYALITSIMAEKAVKKE